MNVTSTVQAVLFYWNREQSYVQVVTVITLKLVKMSEIYTRNGHDEYLPGLSPVTIQMMAFQPCYGHQSDYDSKHGKSNLSRSAVHIGTPRRFKLSMSEVRFPKNEVDQLLLNAQLRDELEPYMDESVELVDASQMSTEEENSFLQAMLCWERSPVIPISQWFEPELQLPHPDTLSDRNLSKVMWDALERLAEQRIYLQCTDHLSDRQLYCVLYRDILPATEKKLDLPQNDLIWKLVDLESDPELWLTYYADSDERYQWEFENNRIPPAPIEPPFSRKLPEPF